jgi:hypothetical protein
MRQLNDKGQMQMIGAAVGLFISLIIVVLIYYNIAASVDVTAIDAKLHRTRKTKTRGELAHRLQMQLWQLTIRPQHFSPSPPSKINSVNLWSRHSDCGCNRDILCQGNWVGKK